MKRDMQLIRRILMAIEEEEKPINLEKLRLLNLDEKKVDHHVWLLLKSGFIKADVKYFNEFLSCGIVHGLTFKGQDFLDLIRDMKVFNMTNEAIKAYAETTTFKVFREVATSLTSAQIVKRAKHPAFI